MSLAGLSCSPWRRCCARRAVTPNGQLATATTAQRTLKYAGSQEGDAVVRPARVVGLGGSLRAASTSLTALKAALEGATAAEAEVQLLSLIHI